MKAILTDITMCIGCRECVIACKKVNGLERELPRRWVLEDGLSARNWTSVVERPDGFVRKQCRHCLQPACASVCPVAALEKQSSGAVTYDSNRCMGCRYCMMACPYGIPRYDWESRVPTVRKCILCNQRVLKGEEPGCTGACPTGATIFGERQDMLDEARSRIEAEPQKYLPKIWGEKEVGGTGVLYISNIDLDFLTYGQKLSDEPMPQLTAPAMEAVPYAFIGMGVFMTGLNWIIKRRIKAEEASRGHSPSKKEES
jgi:formate dehydrogenase iron-sulfur subunit